VGGCSTTPGKPGPVWIQEAKADLGIGNIPTEEFQSDAADTESRDKRLL
jgi:hypothetical protein